MPYDSSSRQTKELFTYGNESGLRGVLTGVDQLAQRLQRDARTFESKVSELQKSQFYQYMQRLKSDIIG